MLTPLADSITVSPAVTTEMLTPVIDLLVANIAVIMPVGIVIYGVLKGIGLIPRVFGMFIHG
jgi:hypothetical protein